MTRSRPVELLIFDLDGTIVDSAPDIAAAANHVLEEMGRALLQSQVRRNEESALRIQRLVPLREQHVVASQLQVGAPLRSP